MNGAESLLRSLVANGVEVCFANPGTSEMHFVSALDKVPEMRAILALHENVATGAADGYGRMARKPACTLLHLGPGLANGLSNLHNARRAGSPIVNIVGDHAASHLQYDAPLTSDIKGFARPVSDWVRSSASAGEAGFDAATAVIASLEAPGQVATLILPADTAWQDTEEVAGPLQKPHSSPVPMETVKRIAALLKPGLKIAILMRGEAVLEQGLAVAGRIAAHTGARLISDTFTPRIRRGAGEVTVERLPYFAEQVVPFLADIELLVLVGSKPPVSFFAYPDKPSWLTPQGCRLAVLSHAQEDGVSALRALAEICGASSVKPTPTIKKLPDMPSGSSPLSPDAIMRIVARGLPHDAILADESLSSGFAYYGMTEAAAPHDFLNITGGAIGSLMAVSVGAAVACPGRKVITLQGDGSAMYILPALWTQARERLDVVTVIYANRAYSILNNELRRVGAGDPGRRSAPLMSLEDPSIDWVNLATGLGVHAVRAETCRQFADAFADAMKGQGPALIEARI
jgi:acetolactate synthase I/II/III large subunit